MAGVVSPIAPTEHRSRGVCRIHVAVTTDASGDATLATIGQAFGRLVGVMYDGGLDASASVTLKDHKTGATLFGPYVTGTEGTPVLIRPSTVVVDTAGTAVTAADTAPNVNRPIVASGKVDLVVSAGGNAETCVLGFIFDETVPGLGELALTV